MPFDQDLHITVIELIKNLAEAIEHGADPYAKVWVHAAETVWRVGHGCVITPDGSDIKLGSFPQFDEQVKEHHGQ